MSNMRVNRVHLPFLSANIANMLRGFTEANIDEESGRGEELGVDFGYGSGKSILLGCA